MENGIGCSAPSYVLQNSKLISMSVLMQWGYHLPLTTWRSLENFCNKQFIIKQIFLRLHYNRTCVMPRWFLLGHRRAERHYSQNQNSERFWICQRASKIIWYAVWATIDSSECETKKEWKNEWVPPSLINSSRLPCLKLNK